MGSKIYTLGALALAVVLFIAVNIVSNTKLTGARLDLTQHQLFTLSEGTRRTVQSLEEPVNLKLYLSQKLATRLPSVASYAARVRELLGEYALASDGKVNVTIIDPEPFSEEEDRAVASGLQGVPLSDGESTFYFGIVGTNSVDDVESLPYLSIEREEFLEYDLTKLIYSLGTSKREVIGVLSSLPLDGMSQQAAMQGQPAQPWLVLEQVQQLFEVKTIATTVKTIPADVSVLMLVHPKNLSDTTLYAIDQFVMRGGRILAFVDPNAEADASQRLRGMPPLPQSSQLEKLMTAWGIEMDVAKSVGDLQLALKVRTQRGQRTVTVEYPPWINIPSQLQNPDDIITGKLGNLTFGSAGALSPLENATTTFSPLVRSTDSAMLMNNELIGPMADLEHLKRVFEPAGKQFVLAARLKGPAKSAFDAAPPAESLGKDDKKDSTASTPAETTPHIGEASDINIVIVADSDFLQDQFWVQVQGFLGQRLAVPIAANGSFVANALENLAGSADLISVRSRGRFVRPFTRVNELKQKAELTFREKETQLLKQLEETEKRLEALQSGKGENSLVLGAAQRQEIDNFRQQQLSIRKDLREVRRELRKDIETLEGWLKFTNIGLVPILIAIGGIILGVYRMRRRRVVQSAASPIGA